MTSFSVLIVTWILSVAEGLPFTESHWENGSRRVERSPTEGAWLERWPDGCLHQKREVNADGEVIRTLTYRRSHCQTSEGGSATGWYLPIQDTAEDLESIEMPADGDAPSDAWPIGSADLGCHAGTWTTSSRLAEDSVSLERTVRCNLHGRVVRSRVCLGQGKRVDCHTLPAGDSVRFRLSPSGTFLSVHVPTLDDETGAWRGDVVRVANLTKRRWVLGPVRRVVSGDFFQNGYRLEQMLPSAADSSAGSSETRSQLFTLDGTERRRAVPNPSPLDLELTDVPLGAPQENETLRLRRVASGDSVEVQHLDVLCRATLLEPVMLSHGALLRLRPLDEDVATCARVLSRAGGISADPHRRAERP